MTIGFDGSRAFDENPTGTENYSAEILKNMLSIDAQNSYIVYVRPGYRKPDWGLPANAKIELIDFPLLWTQLGLASKTFTEPIDVLFVPSHTLPLIRKPGLPTVMTVHDLGAEYLPTTHQLKQQLYLNFITHHQLKTASHLIAVSEATKKDLITKVKIPSKNISVVYEGVKDMSKSEPSLHKVLSKIGMEEKGYFLFVGTIQPRKNLDRIIEAYSLFLIESKQQINLPDLVIAGKPGWDYEAIVNLPERLGIKSKVKFIGRVDDLELSALYKGAICLTYPSLFEGFGLPILEAYQHNCPVITSATSSMPEIAGKGAILVDPKQTSAIMRAMLEIYQNKAKRAELATEGRKQLAKFSWKKAAQETLEILENVARRGS